MAALDAPVRILPLTQRLFQEANIFELDLSPHDVAHRKTGAAACRRTF
ncbi:MAG: hypothetical protein K0R08_364 [Solimicrobium sp.]|jgi:hypothetical protein|nr:hypothetical protein [Solimicrobium sp.]